MTVSPNEPRPSVAVVGGGYGGVIVAKALDEVADVVLVEPRDAFVHNVAALRALVDPRWAERIFLPYDRLLTHGRVLRDRAVRVDAEAVTLGTGARLVADYVVLATGSEYPFPAKTAADDRATAVAMIHAAREALARAERVLLLGAGPVGVELAGEIAVAWPGKRVTIVDPVADLVSGGADEYPDDLREELRRQLDALGVELVLGTSLREEEPPAEPGEVRTFTVTTWSGREITADVWFRCFGVVPATSYLGGPLANARRRDGCVDVTPELRLPGQERHFAIGDITAIPEAKLAFAAATHAQVVAGNIRAMIAGGHGSGGHELTAYEPGPAGLSVPLGPRGGASYLPQAPQAGVLGAAVTSDLKGVDLLTAKFAELLGLA